MNLMPVASLIENAGLAEAGKTLFVNHFPAEVEQGVLIRERLTGAYVTPELPGYIRPDSALLFAGVVILQQKS